MSSSTLLKNLCWGNSVALAWCWGFGTYLSIQVALTFGLYGLLIFAIPNAVGLILFGVGTNLLAKKLSANKIDFLNYFCEKTKKCFPIFMLFQFLALSINAFGFIRYVSLPLGYSPLMGLLILFLIPMILIWKGRTENIKWIHLAFGAVIIPLIFYISYTLLESSPPYSMHEITTGLVPIPPIYWVGSLIASIVIFLVSPWMDIQHWQRAIQIQKEGGSLSRSYVFGGSLFFLVMFFHGCLALYLKSQGIHFVSEPLILGLQSYRYSVITTLAHEPNMVGTGYLMFLFFIALGGIASSLASFRWYFEDIIKSKAENSVFTLYVSGLIIACIAAMMGLHLEVYLFLFSFFLLYTYRLTFGLFALSEPLYVRWLLSLSILYGIYLFLSLSQFNSIGGALLILSPFVLIIFWFWSKRIAISSETK